MSATVTKFPPQEIEQEAVRILNLANAYADVARGFVVFEALAACGVLLGRIARTIDADGEKADRLASALQIVSDAATHIISDEDESE